MDYFIHHVGYIIIAAICIAVVGIIVVVAGHKNAKLSEEHGQDPDWDSSKYACAGCKFFQVCSGTAKPEDAASELINGELTDDSAFKGCMKDRVDIQ